MAIHIEQLWILLLESLICVDLLSTYPVVSVIMFGKTKFTSAWVDEVMCHSIRRANGRNPFLSLLRWQSKHEIQQLLKLSLEGLVHQVSK